MGRIGRSVFRLLVKENLIHHLVAVNDLMPLENLVYLLQYDSVRGPFQGSIEATEGGLLVNGHFVHVFQQADPQQLSWKALGVELVVEATGHFTGHAKASCHLAAGAKKVLLTTFSPDIAPNVRGVNGVWKEETPILSPGDCTMNAVSPVVHALDQNFGVESAFVNVIQAYTTRQELLDGEFKGLRRGRAAAHSIIPFEVLITPQLESLFPKLKGKISTMSTRVPIVCGALAELTLRLKTPTSKTEVNSLFAEGQSNTITGITFAPIVSADIINSTLSGMVDGALTQVIEGTQLRLLVWFDNEWGYSNRLVGWIKECCA